MTIIGSPDITSLEVQVTWDISGSNPVISLVNLSTGTGLANLTWWFAAYSPTNTKIHLGDVNNVDITGAWSTYVLTDSWPTPNKQIEWSGAPYSITIYAKDSNGLISSIYKSAAICPPSGSLPTSKNKYGSANVYVKVLCDKGRIYFEDQSNVNYKGNEGTRISAVLRVAYPLDDTGVATSPFDLANFSNVMVPITFSSPNYQFVANLIYDYDFTNYVHVRIKYTQSRTFPVLCNIDLGGLVCEVLKLSDSIDNGSCADVNAAKHKLDSITPKLLLALIGTIQPLAGGENVPALIDQIIEIGGFDCNCCNVATGIVANAASIIDGYSFDIVSEGGDVGGTVEMNGTNIQFLLHDKSYVFAMYPGSPMGTTAFSISSGTVGYAKTYYLNVNMVQFGTDLANTIKSNSTLLNLWQTILVDSTDFKLTVDGECIFQSTSTCDYNFVLNGIPANTTYALLNSMTVEGVPNSLSRSFNLTSLSDLQSYLNALGFGTFVVTAPFPNPASAVYIASTANPNDITAITFKISGTTYIADLTKNCTGYVAISADEVVQKIITYICNLDDTQIVTSQDYVINSIDVNGVLQSVTVDAASSLNDLIIELLNKGNTSITFLQANTGTVTCDKMKEVFTQNIDVPTSLDYLFGTKGNGACSRLGFLEAFNYMLSSGVLNATTKALFCDFVASCADGLTCAPYDYIEVFVTQYDTACTEILGIEFTLS